MKYKELVLIDDDEDDLEIFKTALARVAPKANCRTFFDPTQALVQLEAMPVLPQLIFLDLNMPVMNGQQFLFAIKKKKTLKNIPVIIFSTTSDKTTIELTLGLGAKDFITKPDKYDELVGILKKYF